MGMKMKSRIGFVFLLCLLPTFSYSQMYDDETDDYSYRNSDDYSYGNSEESDDPSFANEFNDSSYSEDEFDRPRYEVNEVDASPNGVNSAPIPYRIKSYGEKVVLVDPKEHVFGAYNAKGVLVRWGLATSGGNWCRDIDAPCQTKAGSFRIYSSGDRSCVSTKFPIPDGGAPMPYCMYFNGGQALHGSNEVVYDNVSHGCVRLHVSDAEWLRYQFVENPNKNNHYQGTKVIIKPYF